MRSEAAAVVLKESPDVGSGGESPAALENRLEALRALSNLILREVEGLKKARKTTAQGKINLADELQRFEIDLINGALLRTGGKQRQAARLLSVKVTTLNAKIKRYGITFGGLFKEKS